jgi:hypothetical protein
MQLNSLAFAPSQSHAAAVQLLQYYYICKEKLIFHDFLCYLEGRVSSIICKCKCSDSGECAGIVVMCVHLVTCLLQNEIYNYSSSSYHIKVYKMQSVYIICNSLHKGGVVSC